MEVTTSASNLIDPYPPVTVFPDEWSHEYPEHWLEDGTEPACVCEAGLGWLPLPEGGFIECHVCGAGEH